MQDDKTSTMPARALPALLCALLVVGTAGADLLDSIAIAIVLLPVCEAAYAASDAADEESALAVSPRRPRQSWRRAARLFFRRVQPQPVRRFRGALDGVALPLLA